MDLALMDSKMVERSVVVTTVMVQVVAVVLPVALAEMRKMAEMINRGEE